MTSWTEDKKSPPPYPPAAASRGDDLAAATPFSMHPAPEGFRCISSIREDDGSCEFCGAKTPDVVATPLSAADLATATPFCDEYCLKWFNIRLHTIDCDIANGRDPILPDRSVMRGAVRETPYGEEE